MFFVIEGIDRTGKTTLVNNLLRTANESHIKCSIRSFPAYNKTVYGKMIRMYLDGYFGLLNKIDINFINLMYSSDRYALKDDLINEIKNNNFVICDRYTASNLAYSSAKEICSEFGNKEIKSLESEHISIVENMISKVSKIEQELMELPKPNLYILLDSDYENLPTFGKGNKDIHEKDTNYINIVSLVYRYLAKFNIMGTWKIIKLSENGNFISQSEITNKIWNEVILPFTNKN